MTLDNARAYVQFWWTRLAGLPVPRIAAPAGSANASQLFVDGADGHLKIAHAASTVDLESAGAGAVTSVFGRVGAVVADAADYSAYYVVSSRTVNGHVLTADVTVTAADLGLGNVENTALSTWAGSTNLTTLGTITAGTWHGTAIADGYIASAATWNAKASTAYVDAGDAAEAATRAAADAALAAPDYVVKTATGTLAAERVLTDSAPVTWDWSTGGVVKAVLSAALNSVGGLTPAADKLAYYTGASSAALATLTASARVFLALVAARGGLIVSDAAASWAQLAIGSAGKFLRSDGTDPSWQSLASTDIAGMTNSRVIGRNTAGSGASEEVTLSQVLDWIGSAARGDLLARGAATWARLAIGGAGTALRSDGTDPAWATVCPAVFGDGSDGSLTYDGSTTILGMAPASSVYTLTRDIYASDLTINAGVTIKSAGFAIFVSGTLTFTDSTSIIHWDGNAASGLTQGASVSGGTLGSNGGSSGATGRSSTGAGSAGSGPTNSPCGASGAGGTAGGANTGGAAGTPTAPAAATHGWRHLGFVLRGWRMVTSASQASLQGIGLGAGGGAGGCDVSGGGTASSGGGGGGAGIVGIAARLVVGAGTVRAQGGTGGTAVQTGAGKAGGGGGGGGGFVDVTSTTRTLPCTLSAAGGTGGAGANGGASGATGSAGTTIARIV